VSIVRASNSTGYAAVYREQSQSIPNNADTQVQFDLVEFDEFGFYDAVNFRFVIPAGMGGLYSIASTVDFFAHATGRRAHHIESSIGRLASQQLDADASGSSGQFNVWVDELLEPGDTIHAEVFQNSGGALDITSFTTGSQIIRMSISRVQVT
jgi:hypothetical protein